MKRILIIFSMVILLLFGSTYVYAHELKRSNSGFSSEIILFYHDSSENAISEEVNAYASSLEAFVSRLYENFLGRPADKEGLSSWVSALRSGKATGSKVVYGFVYSQEFRNNPLSNVDFVTALYNTIFDRKPDASGLKAWVSVLENGCTKKKVLSGFLNSKEMINLCSKLGIAAGSYHSDEIIDQNSQITFFVSRMYWNCLNRKADYNGLTYWVSGLVEGRVTGRKMAEGFFYSDEMKHRNLNNREYVTIAYRALLAREPDTDGLASWINALNRSGNREKIINSFVKSDEFRNLCAQYGIMVEDKTELLKSYLKNELLPVYGLARVGTQYVLSENGKTKWLNYTGIVSAQVIDLDKDGDEELLVIRFGESADKLALWFGTVKQYEAYATVYEVENGVVRMSDEEVLCTFNEHYASPIEFYENEFADVCLHVSFLDINGKINIAIEYSSFAKIFADGAGVYDCWTMCYRNGELSLTSMVFMCEIEGGNGEYWAYDFRDGKLISKEKIYTEEYGVKNKYSSFGDALSAFWGRKGVQTKVLSKTRFDTSSIFAGKSILLRAMSITTNFVEYTRPGSVAKIKFEAIDYTDMRSW